ncbi:Desumoylating isopeptidase 1 [Ananas comosus]|uniref:Desumoylating isopeptidase 1 n=1 Tax=Ananas comosus TaxID=4615 RepID=A0A199VK73_ANACO|nr:Desumoylating isopeptidase 1 [Ananas comosus]
MEEGGYKVKLNVYDLSQGLARQLSTTFLGKAIEAIWHTGVVVYGTEYYFGAGIQQDPAGRTPYGTPVRVVDLGVTHVPKEVFEDYLQEISGRYTPETYNLLSHNCNNFSNEVAQFLVGASIPSYILELPSDVMNSPMVPMIQRLETTMRSGAVPQAPQFIPPSPAVAQPPPANKTPSSTTTNSPVKSDSRRPASESSAKTAESRGSSVPPAADSEAKTKNAQSSDPLREARQKVQEEITREFAAIMATGTLRASEAAALATRRVMERHGRPRAPMRQQG